MRIEVGSGLEGALTDAVSGRIIRHEMIPRFREGDPEEGIRAGVEAIMTAIAGEYSSKEVSDFGEEFSGKIAGALLFIVVIGTFTLLAILSSGFASWFLFVFLIPFWVVFPIVFLGYWLGILPVLLYIAVFVILKIWMATSVKGKSVARKWATLAMSPGGWSSRGGSFGGGWSSSGGGGGFSGGGGGFSGGGASGRW
jgi:uncharacterized protein